MPTVDDVLAKQDGTQFAIALSDLVFPRFDRDGLASLTPAEKTAYCVDALEREVNNGGFDQFFSNSSGDTAQETVDALEAIGARVAAGLVREAIARIPAGPWEDLDERFCAYPDDLTTLMRRYVESHRQEFRPWP